MAQHFLQKKALKGLDYCHRFVNTTSITVEYENLDTSWTYTHFEKNTDKVTSVEWLDACNCKGKHPCSTPACRNRNLKFECDHEGECGNKRIQTHGLPLTGELYPFLNIYTAISIGVGVKCHKHIMDGQQICEFVGEVTSPTEYFNLVETKYKLIDHSYAFIVKSGYVLDATMKGNTSRYFNHSCTPNCATEVWNVKDELRIIIVALCDIKSHTELTISYHEHDEEDMGWIVNNYHCNCGKKVMPIPLDSQGLPVFPDSPESP